MAMVHAENADCIEWLTKRLEAAGRTAPRFHAHARPMLVEREATHRAIALAELVDVPILIVHVSGREAVEQIRWARAHGLKVFAETCPQYLFLTAADLGIDDSYHGARCVCSPPPRDKANQEVIWDGLNDGLFTVFSSDHAPFNVDSPEGKKPGGEEVAFRHIPNGIPGIETRMPLLYSEGVLGGPHDARTSSSSSPRPARPRPTDCIPRKGTIAVGSDADLVIWDEREFVLGNQHLHHAVDHTPYEGMTLRAWPGHDDRARRGRVGRQPLPPPPEPRPLPALRRPFAAAPPQLTCTRFRRHHDHPRHFNGRRAPWRRADPAHPPKQSIKRVAGASLAGTTLEYYDHFVYGSAAALVFPKLFFSQSEPLTAMLLSLASYSVAYFARPFGAALFGHFGDKLGRKWVLVVTLMLMGLSTFAIGLLPTFAAAGIAAPALLVLLRVIQGVALGGEWGGAALIVNEFDPAGKRRGFYGSLVQVAAPIGLLLANGVFALVTWLVSEEAFMSWGWRVPFLSSAILIAVGLYIRMGLTESPLFAKLEAQHA